MMTLYSKHSAGTNRYSKPQVETLELRRLMAANIFLDAGGIVRIDGTDSTADTAVVSVNNKGTASTADDQLLVSLKWNSANATGQLSQIYNLNSVSSVVFKGYAGDDKFDNNTAVPSNVDGGDGADILLGGLGIDMIRGRNGNDYIDGRLGSDKLYGDAGNDVIFGDIGNDYIYGGTGNDSLFGGAGMDFLYGESGHDLMDGGANVEGKILGGVGNDTFVDDTNSFPGNDIQSGDKTSTQHSAAAMFDYQVSNRIKRSADRLNAYLQTQNPPVVDYNVGILAFAQSKLGQKVGDGGCTRLLEGALENVGARGGQNFNSPGNYVWGRLLGPAEPVRPGDMIQFSAGTRFQTPTSSMWMDSYFGHAAIIESISGTTVTLLNQNMAGSPVIRTTIDLSTKVFGSYSIYRAVPK